MRYLHFRKQKVAFILIIIALLSIPVTAKAAEAPYTTLTTDKNGYFVSSQDGYIPSVVYDKFGDETLNKPSDLFISKNRKIYIADTGNGRVLICDMKGNLLQTVKDGLIGPTGVYADGNDTLYIADPKAKKILSFSSDGKKVKEYGLPNSPLFSKDSKYAPSKLVVNSVGSIYALSEGNGNGILNFSKEGDFYGYFGANNTYISIFNIIRRKLFTKDMLSAMQSNVPSSATNIDMDANGLIYTVTQGKQGYSDCIKKFNMAAKNMLSKAWVDKNVADIAVGDIENIFTVSSQGYIYEYTRDNELLFLFGGTDDGKNRNGLFTSPTAIDVDTDGNLYVLDSGTGCITVFEQTEYAKTVHKALNLFQEGKYVDSQKPWTEVLRKNSLFDYAHRGIGKAFYRLGNYKEAMEEARLGGDYKGYSDAFWELRNTWLRANVIKVFFIITALAILCRILKKIKDKAPGIRSIARGIRRIKNRKLIKQLAFLKYIPKNPADAFYGIKWEGRVSVLSSTIIYFIFFFIYVLNKYYSGFLFKNVEDGYYELGTDAICIFGLFFLCVVCNNLICSIRDGEGSFINIYNCFAYCLVPYIFLKPAVLILSHMLTYNEIFIIEFMNFIIKASICILVVVMIREIQAYSYKETFKCILLTAFTMLVLVAAGIILFALIKQVIDFAVSIFKEGYYRGK